MGKHYVTTALGKKIDMSAMRNQNPNTTPVGLKPSKKMTAKEEQTQVTPVAAKLHATVPSNKPVSSPAKSVATSTEEPIDFPEHHKKGRK